MKTLVIPEGVHAELSASGFHRWGRCAPSGVLPGVNAQSSYAAEGTVAHYIAAEALRYDWKLPLWDALGYFLGKKYRVEGNPPHEGEVTMGMLEAVEVYVKYCRLRVQPKGLVAHGIEEDLTPGLREELPASEGVKALVGGSCDFYAVRHDSDGLLVLEVVDYKHGAGVPVYPEENAQMLYYAVGAYLALPAGVAAGVDKVRLTIVQPRVGDGAARSWDTGVYRLIEVAREIAARAERVLELRARYAQAGSLPQSEFAPGKDRCRWCSVQDSREGCPALVAKEAELLEFDDGGLNALSTAKLAEYLPVAEVIKNRISRFQELAYGRAKAGEEIPGFKLVEGKVSRVWTDPRGAAEWAEAHIGGEDIYTPRALKSIPQLEKVAKERGLPEVQKTLKEEGEGVIAKVPGKLALVPNSDRRPAVRVSRAVEFSKCETGVVDGR